MKYYETTFDEYIKSIEYVNFNEKNKLLLNNSDVSFSSLNNLILYGPPGSGKYSQALLYIKQFSSFDLKYEKKLIINQNGKDFICKISDIHYEIDMSLLGCNSKLLWNELFSQIIDIISIQKNTNGFILCKNFHNIQFELLDIFYSYIQRVYWEPINIKFILITENVSFIPENILNNMMIINYSKFTKNILKSKFNKIKTNEIENLKDLYCNQNFSPTDNSNEYLIYDEIVDIITNKEGVKFSLIREKLYALLVYNFEINNCLFSIIKKLLRLGYITESNIQPILNEIFISLIYYNNNYRPIYHLEKIICIILKNLNEPTTSN